MEPESGVTIPEKTVETKAAPAGTITIHLHSELAPGVIIDISASGHLFETKHIVAAATEAINTTIEKLDKKIT